MESDRGFNGRRYINPHRIVTLDPSYEVCKKHKLNSQIEARKSAAPFLDDTTDDSGSDTASEEDEVPAISATKQVTTVSVGLGGLNRAQMERERLERLKRTAKKENLPEPPAKRIKVESEQPKEPAISATMPTEPLQYPEGTIKWTFAAGYRKESHHITIEEVLEKDTLKAAVLSGFQVLFLYIL